jgi:hypothetical protein
MSPRPLTQIKHFTDGLVVRWVTTSESPLLYVFDLLTFAISIYGIVLFLSSKLCICHAAYKRNLS